MWTAQYSEAKGPGEGGGRMAAPRPTADGGPLGVRAQMASDTAPHTGCPVTMARTVQMVGARLCVAPGPDSWQLGPVGLFPRVL